MSRLSCPVARVAVVAALFALGLTLSACGRKGPLDQRATGTDGGSGRRIELDQEGRPLTPPGQKKRIPLDVLLD